MEELSAELLKHEPTFLISSLVFNPAPYHAPVAVMLATPMANKTPLTLDIV